ncbi:Nucleotidylyl transferase [Auriculariales sp. MPI-PUGE-AT-0066]|nr:Nucleotidylyl transferase [Auriculariales sp. MPI-PUGE-AT-0066]
MPGDAQPKTTRLWLDGCFDGFHFAHANAVRQAAELIKGPVHITVGIHSDEDILKNKGPTLFEERERYTTYPQTSIVQCLMCFRYDLMRGCRWVDEVAEGVPYVTQLEVINEHDIDYVVHGDDVVLDANGMDCYGFAKAAGRYKEVKRTNGISTTSLIDRVMNSQRIVRTDQHALRALLDQFSNSTSPHVPVVDFINGPAQLNAAFSSNRALIFGAFDCFGAGHVELLRRSKEALPPDTALVVGLWDDVTVQVLTGEPPLLAHLERALALVQCLHVDAVLLYFPLSPSPAGIKSLGIAQIVSYDRQILSFPGVEVTTVQRPALLDVPSLRERVNANLELYADRQKRKGLA